MCYARSLQCVHGIAAIKPTVHFIDYIIQYTVIITVLSTIGMHISNNSTGKHDEVIIQVSFL